MTFAVSDLCQRLGATSGSRLVSGIVGIVENDVQAVVEESLSSARFLHVGAEEALVAEKLD